MIRKSFRVLVCAAAALALPALSAQAQVPPSAAEVQGYVGLHAAAAAGNVGEIDRLVKAGADPAARDSHGRTPLHVAAHGGHHAAAAALLRLGANPNALDSRHYDIVTIAAVRNDLPMLKVALEGGGNPRAITSPYDGTALIAAAHLGHAEVVKMLIAAGAPLDHVNNLGWTAAMEAVVLGDGGRNHAASLAALASAGANVNIPDRGGKTPLAQARERGFPELVRILERAGAR